MTAYTMHYSPHKATQGGLISPGYLYSYHTCVLDDKEAEMGLHAPNVIMININIHTVNNVIGSILSKYPVNLALSVSGLRESTLHATLSFTLTPCKSMESGLAFQNDSHSFPGNCKLLISKH